MTSGLVSDTLEETRVLSSLSNDFIQLTRTGDILTKCISAINALKSASTSDTSKKTYSFSEIQISVKKLFRIIRSSLTSGDTQTVGISLLKMLNSNVKDATGKVEQLTTIATKMTKFNERVVSSLTKVQETAETLNGEKFSSSEILLITEDGSGFTDQDGAELFVQKSKAVLTSKLHILAQNTDAVEKAISIITMQSEKEDQEEDEDEEEEKEVEKLKRKEKKSRKSVGFKKFLMEIKKFSTSIKEIKEETFYSMKFQSLALSIVVDSLSLLQDRVEVGDLDSSSPQLGGSSELNDGFVGESAAEGSEDVAQVEGVDIVALVGLVEDHECVLSFAMVNEMRSTVQKEFR